MPVQVDWSAAGVELVKNQPEQSVRLQQNTVFQVTINDENGCSAADSWLVKVEEGHKIYAPNAIYPGNPSGTNRAFLMYAGPDALEIDSLQIFDRWENRFFSASIFHPTTTTRVGTVLFGGKPVAPGVFV